MTGEDSSTRGGSGPGYEALVSSAALFEDPGRAVLRIEGERAASVMNGLVSADVGALDPGDATLSFVLSSKGRPLAVPIVIRLANAFLFDLSREALPGLLDHFATYLPPRFASVDVLEEARRLSLIGPRATEVESGVPVPGQEDEKCIRVARPPQEGTGFDFLFPDGGAGADELVGALELSGAVPATESDYETWRIEMGIPRFGIDITPDNLPQETGLIERAVSFEKGCYTGQEVVARIHYRGRVQKHLRGLEALESPAGMPAAGLSLSNRGREAGVITSWCISPRFGPIGLAYVRREVSPGETVRLECDPPIPCRVRELPFTST